MNNTASGSEVKPAADEGPLVEVVLSEAINTTEHLMKFVVDDVEFSILPDKLNQVRMKSIAKPARATIRHSLDSVTRKIKATMQPIFVSGTGLPKDEGQAIFVSMPVGEFLARHPDVWSGPVLGPDTGPDNGIRDAQGRPAGTRAMIVYKPATAVIPVTYVVCVTCCDMENEDNEPVPKNLVIRFASQKLCDMCADSQFDFVLEQINEGLAKRYGANKYHADDTVELVRPAAADVEPDVVLNNDCLLSSA